MSKTLDIDLDSVSSLSYPCGKDLGTFIFNYFFYA